MIDRVGNYVSVRPLQLGNYVSAALGNYVSDKGLNLGKSVSADTS